MESIWSKTSHRYTRPSLESHIKTDVAVIGGGMAGILTAWQLQQAGVQTIVIEAGHIGGGQTQNTTAKITSQHGMFCYDFIQKKGEETARKYVEANELAIQEYKRIIGEKGIHCDFTECDAFVYSSDENKLLREVEAAQKLGVSASLEKWIEIPLSCAGAVRFPNQAQFHPLKFMTALAEELIIYEDTFVKSVGEHLIRTSGGSIRAEKIIFATHYPFIDFPGFHFTRMHQKRSYVLALENAGKINGMYIGDGENALSFRQYDKYILLGGQGHRTGENFAGGCYDKLEAEAKKLYPESRVVASWSAQDCITTDKVPFIGQYALTQPNWYVATGFNKWGMTSSMVAAMLLRDKICGIENQYEKVFTPARFSTEEIPQLAKDGAKSVKNLTKGFFQQGAITCSHMGCQMEWNPDEETWDCPCHGSRFTGDGRLISGPAQEGIGYE